MKMIVAFVALIISAAASAAVERTWQRAPVYVPGQWMTTTVDRVQSESLLPVVIYLHGCTGIYDTDRAWARLLKDNGYVVIMPDSMARWFRSPACDPRTHSRDARISSQVHDLRTEELNYALARVRELSWVDQQRIYVMGHSEGARAVALNRAEGARAAIISAWTCGNWHGLGVDPQVPVLHLVFSRDPWYWKTRWDNGRCRDYRADVETVEIDQSNHDTAGSLEMRRAVIEFLDRHQ